MIDETIDLETMRTHLERDTRIFFSRWYRRLLRWTLRKMVSKADELRDKTDYGHSTCGCYVDDIHNTLCFWHGMEAYLR